MKSGLILLGLLALVAGCKESDKKPAEVPANSKSKESLVIDTNHARFTYIYDPTVISKTDLKRFIDLPSACPPNPTIETCVESDKEYQKPCGKENFTANAEINLRRFEKEKEKYDTLTKTLPPELVPIAAACQKEMAFYGTIQARLLKYRNSRDANLLKDKILTFDPKIISGKEIEAIENETDADKQVELLNYGWYNKLNGAFRDGFEKLKRADQVWEDFLKVKKITVETKCLADCHG